MARSAVFYKYRSFDNFEFALDIVVNQRLYAANFRDLNDPMEGRFVYKKGTLTSSQLGEIRGEKSRFGVLSLSETKANMLMWSYYAAGHTGFVVGVEVRPNQEVLVRPVKYTNHLTLKTSASTRDPVAVRVLTKKLALWKHEKEHRVFSKGSAFVDVKVKEIVFGLHADFEKAQLLEAVAKKFCPGVKVSQIKRRQLDAGDSVLDVPRRR